MPFDENILKDARRQIGDFFRNRRIQMGHSLEHAARFIGITANTLSRIEQGKFHWDIDLHHKLCEAYEIKPFLVPKELLDPKQVKLPTFLMVPDPEKNELYILHREYPTCLIHVVQTVPVSFHIADFYDFCTEEEIAKANLMEKVQKFYREYVERNQDLN
jgi:transcriptional regulator with XRE-family HTH domain